jgi:hypothetical protein
VQWSGPILESAAVLTARGAADAAADVIEVKLVFTKTTAGGLHFAGAADCIICCSHRNGSALMLRVENKSDVSQIPLLLCSHFTISHPR